MPEDQTTGGGVRLHHTVLSETDAERFEGQMICQVKDEALIGQRGIAYGRTHAGEVAIDDFGGSLCQAVLHRLEEQRVARAARAVVAGTDRRGKESDAVSHVGRIVIAARGYEVGEAEAGFVGLRVLLSQEGEAGTRAIGLTDHNVVTLAIGITNHQGATRHDTIETEMVHESLALGTYLQSLLLVGPDTPRIVEVGPIDVGQEFRYAVRSNRVHCFADVPRQR